MISFLCSGTKKDHYPESEREVVFVGRSNVGKSSLINILYVMYQVMVMLEGVTKKSLSLVR